MNELGLLNLTPQQAQASSAVRPASGRAPQAAAVKPAPDGRPVEEQGGKQVPKSGKTRPVEPPPIETKAAVEQLNQYLRDSHRSLQFEIDKERGRTIIRVVNPRTQEVIREIPPDAVRVMAAASRAGGLHLVNKLA